MKSLDGYIGELVLVGGFTYEILWFEVRRKETRGIAYSDELGREISMSVRDILGGLVAEPSQPALTTA